MAKDIIIRGAQPDTKDQKVETVYIEIAGHFPYSIKDEELDQVREGFKEDAKKLFDGLRSLPGGTFDQLLILMLQKQASSFIVPHNFHDAGENQPKSSMLILLEKAYPLIEEEAERRESAVAPYGKRETEGDRYWSEMRDLANEISAEIDRARGKGGV